MCSWPFGKSTKEPPRGNYPVPEDILTCFLRNPSDRDHLSIFARLRGNLIKPGKRIDARAD